MELLNHQKDFLDRNYRKCVLVWETGTGKTFTSIKWAEKIGIETLVICPKTLKTNWERSTKDYPGKFIIVTKEEFKKKVNNNELGYFNSIIIDEAHYFAGIKSQLSKVLIKYIERNRVANILCLTATPYMSTPLNIYTLGKIVGKKEYRWSYPYFMNNYFYIVYFGSRAIPTVVKNASVLMAEKIKEMAHVVKLEDCADVPEQTFITEYFSLTDEQKDGIENIKDISHIVRWTKKHQICGGSLKGDEYNQDQFFKCDKLKRLLDIIEENKKTIVVCRYNNEIKNIENELKNSKKVFIINGDIKDKQSVLDKANKEDDCVLLVNASCSEGWEAPTFNKVIFYSYSFSLKDYIQMLGRIQRINALQKCTYISLVIEKTIDEDVYKSITIDKKDFQLKIYENM